MRILKYILLFIFMLRGCISLAQTYSNTGTANLQRAPTAKGYIYRNNMGALGNVNWYTAHQLDSLNYTKSHIDSLLSENSTQNYAFTAPTTGTNTITNSGLIGMYVFGIYRSGLRYDIITTGSPMGNQVLLNGTTGAVTFQDNFNTANAEKGYVEYKSISGGTPTSPTGLQILYAANYATAITYATGTGNKLIYVKNDEVNGGTNPDGSYAASIYQYSNGYLLFYIRTGVQ